MVNEVFYHTGILHGNPKALNVFSSFTYRTDINKNKTGGANVWSIMAADETRDLVFLPTTSP